MPPISATGQTVLAAGPQPRALRLRADGVGGKLQLQPADAQQLGIGEGARVRVTGSLPADN